MSTARPGDVPLWPGLLLLVATGFVDAYTFLEHGHVFAEAMTGNLVLVAVEAVVPGLGHWTGPVSAFVAFVVGVAVMSTALRRSWADRARLVSLVLQVVWLGIVGALPAAFPQPVVVCGIAVVAGTQIAAFRSIGRTAVTTTVMTSNSLRTVEAVLAAGRSHTRGDALIAARYVATLAAFVGGAFVGAGCSRGLGRHAAWVDAALFAVVAVLYAGHLRRTAPAR